MGKPGPKPKAGARTASGRLSQSKEDVRDRKFADAPQQTVLKARRNHMVDPDRLGNETASIWVGKGVNREHITPKEAWRRNFTAPVSRQKDTAHGISKRGSILADMEFRGSLSEAERKAGEKFAKIVERFNSTQGLKRGTPKTASYGEAGGSGAEPSEDEINRAKEAYGRVTRALMRPEGIIAEMHKACLYDQTANPAYVKLGCQALIKLWEGKG